MNIPFISGGILLDKRRVLICLGLLLIIIIITIFSLTQCHNDSTIPEGLEEVDEFDTQNGFERDFDGPAEKSRETEILPPPEP